MSWLTKLRATLSRTRDSFAGVETLATARRPLDDEFWDDLEEALIGGDFGVPTTVKIIDGLKLVAKAQLWSRSDQVIGRFKTDVRAFLTLPDAGLGLKSKPAVVLVVGVNGTGKTTTIGKLASALAQAAQTRDGRRGRHVPRGGSRATGHLGRARAAPSSCAGARDRTRRRWSTTASPPPRRAVSTSC